jgi:hypothetical protein
MSYRQEMERRIAGLIELYRRDPVEWQRRQLASLAESVAEFHAIGEREGLEITPGAGSAASASRGIRRPEKRRDARGVGHVRRSTNLQECYQALLLFDVSPREASHPPVRRDRHRRARRAIQRAEANSGASP